MTVYLHPPTKEWAKQFERQKALLKKHCPSFIEIEHIGSTSIGTIYAKPIIDIGTAIEKGTTLSPADYDALQKIGYVFHPHASTRDRSFFKKEYDHQVVHLHVMELGESEWQSKLLFRDKLRNNERLAKQYEQLKMKLAKEHDRPAYTEAKGPFIEQCLKNKKYRNM
ncbi:GrpB family protein [Kurthia senegalensis]|uniref:GrpB family protein n=1 Tax=Kurthia senegalensis TaxID=1033740 RepID=UPI000288C668|nr:GrpB family protein [Kurthia senegalensis]